MSDRPLYTGTAGNDTWAFAWSATIALDGLAGEDTLSLGTSLRSSYVIKLEADGSVMVDSVSGASQIFSAKLYNFEKVTFNSGRDVLMLDTLKAAEVGANGMKVVGTSGNDTLYSQKGNDTIDGGDGVDRVALGRGWADFQVSRQDTGWQLTDKTGELGTDTLLNVERLTFTDKAIALDVDGVGGKAYRIYKAAFNRTPDEVGLGYWIAQLDNGMDLLEAAARFIDSAEFVGLYGSSVTDDQFLFKVYSNVLGREPDDSGYAWWLNEMKTNPEKTRAKVLADFSESIENRNSVEGEISGGLLFQPWGASGPWDI
ncbi:MAG: hypothetical protein RJA77_374 [Pseudomonadota bacterium]|jgi:Ca2+-binding RTX toxin-like protein